MSNDVYPQGTARLAKRRQSLSAATQRAFTQFSDQVFAEGALPVRTKELIAIAVAHVTQCPYCIRTHTHRARRRGVSAEEMMEAIWIAAEMRAGAAAAHALIAIDAMDSLAPAEQPASAPPPSQATSS